MYAGSHVCRTSLLHSHFRLSNPLAVELDLLSQLLRKEARPLTTLLRGKAPADDAPQRFANA
jgi:hypothetical protein